MNLTLDANQKVQQRNVQYSTGFTLAPGKYHVKFVVRENQSGNMGSFETDIQVPDMKKTPLKLSSIVMSSQSTPNTSKKDHQSTDPRWRGVAAECTARLPAGQHLDFLYEVYSPAKKKTRTCAAPGLAPEAVQVLTSIEFLLGGVKVYETPLVEATSINIPERDAVGFQFDVPLAGLKPGTYVCQVNVIDDAGGSFSFPRMALRVTPGAAASATPVASTAVPARATAGAPTL